MEREKWQTRGAKIFCALAVLFGIYLILKYALRAFLPFLLAIAVAIPICSLAKSTANRCGGKVKSWALFYISVFWGSAAILLLLFIKKLYAEAQEAIGYVQDNIESISEALRTATEKITDFFSRLPILSGLFGNFQGGEVGGALSGLLERAVSAIGSFLGELAGRIALGTPRFFLGGVVLIVSSFYFCADFDKIKEYILGFFSKNSQASAQKFVRRVASGIKAYARAYSLLYLITFFTLCVGLLILRQKYALIIAFVLAFIDLLPLFSAGILLVPWGIVLVAYGSVVSGVGFIVLAALLGAQKQIFEPRFVGRELGIHPLASLVGMYVGLRLFGFWGMVISPIAVLILKESRAQTCKNST